MREPSTSLVHRRRRDSGIMVAISSIVLVLMVTLFPYNLFSPDLTGALAYKEWTWSGWPSGSDPELLAVVLDIVANVFLFVPLGCALGCLTSDRRLQGLKRVIVVSGGGASVSLSVEALQLLLPTRVASFSDILADTLGVLVGFGVFALWGRRGVSVASCVGENIKRIFTLRVATVAFVGYAMGMLVAGVALQGASSLRNWDEDFPLLVGNERGGGRPWRGMISQLEILNRAISVWEIAETVSEGDISEGMEGSTLVRYGWGRWHASSDQPEDLPVMVWRGEPRFGSQDDSLVFDGRNWLETTGSARWLSEELRRRSEFSLRTVVTSADSGQTGPARIVSLSGNPYRRNFTLAQEGSDLVFRLRTALTGVNGMLPELVAPNVFTGTERRDLLVTYDGATLSLFVDSVQRSLLELTPGATLFSYFVQLRAGDMVGYKTIFYVLAFLPLGILLALISRHLERWTPVWVTAFGMASLLPSFALETLLMTVSGKILSVRNIALGVGLTVVPILFSWSVKAFRERETASLTPMKARR